MQILKGFKSCVLKVRILRRLRAHFLEVRILKSLEERDGEGTLAGLHVGRFEGSERTAERAGGGRMEWAGLRKSPG
jgi:hypothetical protein